MKFEKLENLCEVVRGGSPRPKGDPRYFGGTIPWIMISDVTGEGGKYLTRTKETLTLEGSKKSRFLKAGTLILTNSATVGLPKIMKIDGCIHDGFLALLNIKPEIERDYLYYFLLSQRKIIEKMAQSGTQKNLNTGIAKKIIIPLPPLTEQKRIVSILEKLDNLREKSDKLGNELDFLSYSVFQTFFQKTS